jgi:thiol:disulfide interchange protein DsbD
VKEVGKLETRFEDVFNVDTKFFNDKVEFVQVVTLKANVKTSLTGSVEFMTCNDKECLPPKSVDFSIALK